MLDTRLFMVELFSESVNGFLGRCLGRFGGLAPGIYSSSELLFSITSSASGKYLQNSSFFDQDVHSSSLLFSLHKFVVSKLR